MGEEWAREWGRWCAVTRAQETPAQRYAAIRLKGWGPDTRRRPTVIRGAGPDHPWDAATGEWLRVAPGQQTEWTGDVSSLVWTPVPPRIVLHAANVLRATEIHPIKGTGRGHRPVAPPRWRGRPARRGALQSWGAGIRRRPVPAGRHPRALAPHAPNRHCSRAAPEAGRLRRAASCNGSSDSTQIIHQCDQNFNDSQMYISAADFPLVFMFSVRRQMSPVSARRVAFVFRDFPIGFI